MKPTLGNGKICYIEMPSTDVQRSASFYQKIFGWNIRKRGDGTVSLRRWTRLSRKAARLYSRWAPCPGNYRQVFAIRAGTCWECIRSGNENADARRMRT
jgi:hypothetical protein